MFIYNIKINGKNLVKIAFIIMALIITIFFLISIYKILSNTFKVKDEVVPKEVINIEPENYTNILQAVYNNLDTYMGQQICFSGYVYRNIDFQDNQFVLARDMLTNEENKTLIAGFLCECSDGTKYKDNDWVEITGKISKGNYHGEIPIIKINNIKKVNKPDNTYVNMPKDTYIPTSIIF